MIRSWKGWNPVPTKSESPLTTTTSNTENFSAKTTDNKKSISSDDGSSSKCVNAGCIVKVLLVVLVGIGLIVGLAVYFSGSANSLFTSLLHPPVAPPPASPGKSNSSFENATANFNLNSNDTSPSSSSILDLNLTSEAMKSRRVAVLEDLNYLTPSHLLLTPGTPQNSAANWMIYTDPLQLVPSDNSNFRQRYTLAVLYFSLIGNTTENSTFFSGDSGLDDTWLTALNECEWNYVECRSSTPQVSTNNNTPSSVVNVGDILSVLSNESSIKEETMTDDKLVQSNNDTVESRRVVTSLNMNRLNLKSIKENVTSTIKIPDEITTLLQLITLRLSSNEISGTIPISFGWLKHLGTMICHDQIFM